jgi:hypothetical protein
MKTLQCPACASTKIRAAGRHEKSFETKQANPWLLATHPASNQVCQDCWTVWRPQCPRWIAASFISAGIVAIIGWFGVKMKLSSMTGKSQNSILDAITILAGGSAIFTGCRLLFFEPGRMKILGKTQPRFQSSEPQ